ARRKQTRVDRAVGREASAMAIAAERRADRRDEADLALPVLEHVALRDLAAIIAVARLDWPAGRDSREQLFGRHDLLGTPAVHGADVHVFDESHDRARAAKALDEVESRVVVLAAFDHGVDLQRREAGAVRGLQPQA